MFNFRTRRAGLSAAALTMSAALALTGCSGGDEPAAAYDPEEKVTLNFAFWGNDVRAGFYKEAFAAFNEEYPNITVNSSFLAFPEFWEKRQTEAAGGGLPDVMQFDYSYLRQYAENGLLLDLEPYLGEAIETESLTENILDIGVVGDITAGIPTSTNAWGVFTNPKLLEQTGVADYAGGGSWEEYVAWMSDVSEAGKDAGIYGGTSYIGRIQNFEIQLRSEGKELFNEDGTPGFDEERLKEFWNAGETMADGVTIPAQRLEELLPLSGFDAAQVTSEITWDNFGKGYLGNLGEGYTELSLVEPPVTKEGAKDLYLKPSMLHTISAGTEHPEAAAALVDFLINSPKVAEAFGTNRGLPASSVQQEALALEGLDAQVSEYEASIEDRLGEAPPAPIVGFGTIEEKFRQIGSELGFGTLSVDDAVSQFFGEMDIILNQ